jgi:hypothetical protein
MRLFVFTLLMFTSFTASIAHAGDICDQLWFARNKVFAETGYCFKSKLGQTYFDTANCSQTPRALSADEKLQTAQAREMEEEYACKVDSSRSRLDLGDYAALVDLTVTPIPTGHGFSCIGWKGPNQWLYDIPHETGGYFGEISTGNSVEWVYMPLGDWEFVRVTDGEQTVAQGWGKFDNDLLEAQCTAMAG